MDLFDRALKFAIDKHSGQVRKMANSPYILHPMEVATIVGTMSNKPELLAAAVLHDTVEDTDATPQEIETLFGHRVAMIVFTETEDKRPDISPEDSWKIRKQETLAILENTRDLDVKMLWLGDKLSNMRSFYREYMVSGNALWNHFHQKDPAQQKWYYDHILRALAVLKDYPAYQEFAELTARVFENVEAVPDED